MSAASRQRRVGTNVVLNGLGLGLPLIVAVFTIPILIGGVDWPDYSISIAGMGKERFGLLSVVWVILSYFSLFDLGLGLAVTQHLARYHRIDESHERRATFWMALMMVSVVGCLLGLMLSLLAGSATAWMLDPPPHLVGETRRVLFLVAAALPFVVSTTCFSGTLVASHRFGVIAAVRMLQGITTYGAPFVVLLWTTRVDVMASVLIAGRLVAWLGYAVAVFVLMPEFRSRPTFDYAIARSVFRFGGWVTVSNVVSPLYGLLDRMLVGRWASWADVTFYATPAEVMSKTQVISTALIQVLFPSITEKMTGEPALVDRLITSAFGGLLCLMLPLAVLLMAGAEPLLTWWIDADLASRSAGVMQVMVFGMVLNALARVPLIVILAKAKPQWPAVFHLIEFVPFLIMVWIGIRQWGVVGAAVAWTFRVALDFGLLIWAADRLLGRRVLCRGRHLGWLVAALAGLGWIQIGLEPPWVWFIGLVMVGASVCGALVCRHRLAAAMGQSASPRSASEVH